jgi:hypothetical protein
MEEQILKIIVKYHTQREIFDIVDFKERAAKEITAHVFEFIEWLRKYCISSKPKSGWRCYYVDEETYRDFDYSKGFRYFGTNGELYIFWRDNVKQVSKSNK